jgi:tetratricopeptide (TPR) repeat protein
MATAQRPEWTRVDDEDPAALEHMALNGQSERVHALFRRIAPQDRARYQSPRVLRQVLVGGLATYRSLPRDAVALRREESDFLDETVRALAAHSGRTGGAPRELFRCFLDRANLLFEENRLREADEYCELAVQWGVSSFPDIGPSILLQKAAVLAARGEHEAARELLASLYERRDLIADRKLIPEIVFALGRACLLTGRADSFRRLLFEGLAAFYTNLDERRALCSLLRRTYRGGLGLLFGDPRLEDKLLFAAHWLAFGVTHRLAALRRPVGRALLCAVYANHYWRPRSRAARPATRDGKGVLVTRAMGGVGDLLMMTPGLHALRLQSGAPVSLAVPRRYFPLFEGNPDVRLLDIHSRLEPAAWGMWLNQTDCPAARTEARQAPRVRRNRIQIFARGLGVRGRALRSMDRKPRYFLSEAERAFRDRFLGEHGIRHRRIVGVQLRADESYRDYPRMPELVEALAREHVVLLFDAGPIQGYERPGVVKVDRHGLRQALALLSGCDVVVAPDSAFVHASAALELPCVALFGPTDGRVRTADYPLCRFLDARRELRCVPCWRNEEIPCALTGMKRSVCLGEIGVAQIETAVAEALARRPLRDRPGD